MVNEILQFYLVTCTFKINIFSSFFLSFFCGRRGGLMVSTLDSGSRCPGLSRGRIIVLYSWARHFTLTVPLSTQDYKWVPANCQGNLTKCWEVTCDGLASLQKIAMLLVTSCYRNRDKLRQLNGTLGLLDLTFFFF